VYVDHGIRYAQRVLRALSGDANIAKIVRMRLDPTERELRALFDSLDRHQQNFKKIGPLVMRPENVHHQAKR
jgi:hypothetical protein